MAVTLSITGGGRVRYLLPFTDDELTSLVATMARQIGLRGIALELSILDDTSMARLNEEAMSTAGPTNILSFPMVYDIFSPYTVPCEGGDVSPTQGKKAGISFSATTLRGEGCESPFGGTPMIGSLVIAPETLQREAFLYGQPLERYTIFLIAHGMAHLLGYDHGPEMDALADCMEKAC